MNRILYVSKSRLENTLEEYNTIYSSVTTWRSRMETQNSNIAASNEGATTETYTEKTTAYNDNELSDFSGHVNVMSCALVEALTKTRGLIARSEDFVNILKGESAESSDTYSNISSTGDVASYYDNFCSQEGFTGAIKDNTESITDLGIKEEENLTGIEDELKHLKTISVDISGYATHIRDCITKQNYTSPLYDSLRAYCIDVAVMHDYVKRIRDTYFPVLDGPREHNRSYNYDGAPTRDKENIYTSRIKELGFSEKDIEVLKRYTGLTAEQLYNQISHMPGSEIANMLKLAYANYGSENRILVKYNPNVVNNETMVVQRLLYLAGEGGSCWPNGKFDSTIAQQIIDFQKKYGVEFGLTVCEYGENGELVYVDEKTLEAMRIVAERTKTPVLVAAYGDRPGVDLEGNSVVHKDDWLEWAAAQDGFVEANINAKGEGDNKTPYGKFTSQDGEPWCASFVTWSLFMAGDTTLPHTASTASMKEYAEDAGIYHDMSNSKSDYYDPNYIPEPGDVFYRKTSEGGHVGFVSSVERNSDGSYTIRTIEGNSGQKVAGDTLTLDEFRDLNDGVIEMDREEKTSYTDNEHVETPVNRKRTR